MANNEDDPLAKFRGVLPSRAELCQLALFGTSEKIRAAAQSVLDLLPPMTSKEKESWATNVWLAAKLPSVEGLEKSPVGRQTLELLRNSQPVGKGVADSTAENSASESDPSQEDGEESAENSALPAVEPDGVNSYLKQLSWPPKSSAPPKSQEEDSKTHLWQVARPSKPDTSQKPIAPSDWDDRETLY